MRPTELSWVTVAKRRASRPGGEAGVAGGNLAIMDGAETWDKRFGGGFFSVTLHEVGHLLAWGIHTICHRYERWFVHEHSV